MWRLYAWRKDTLFAGREESRETIIKGEGVTKAPAKHRQLRSGPNSKTAILELRLARSRFFVKTKGVLSPFFTHGRKVGIFLHKLSYFEEGALSFSLPKIFITPYNIFNIRKKYRKTFTFGLQKTQTKPYSAF